MAIRYKAWTLALLCCALATPAMADDDDESAYVALNGGKSSAGGEGYFATFGYQYTPMWALEASYGKLGYVSKLAGFHGKVLGLSAAAVATLHMGDDFAVFGKVGVVNADFRQDLTTTAIASKNSMSSLAAGAGMEYSFTPKFSLRVQADYFGTYTIYGGASRTRFLVTTIGLVQRY